MQLLAGDRERAVGRLGVDLRLQLAPEAADPEALAAVHDLAVDDPRRQHGAELDPAGADVDVAARAVVADRRAVDPDPALGVLGAPVVADHARPGLEGDPFAVDFEDPVEAGARVRAEQLRPRQRPLVHPLRGEVMERAGVVLEPEAPAGADRRRRPPPAPAPGRSPSRRRGCRSCRGPTPRRLRPGAWPRPGRGRSASNQVIQTAPVGSSPGRLWTVWRIQIARPPSGAAAFR